MIPTEEAECYALADYLRFKNMTFCHINNEMYTRSWKQKTRQLKMGTAKGFPDYLIIVNGKLIAIEMKRTKNSVTSPEQKKWLEQLNEAGVPAQVCFGASQAIAFIESYSTM